MSTKHYTEWTQEQKDDLARQRMEKMAKKNEEIMKRHAEVEADRRNAELLNSSVTVKAKGDSLSEDSEEEFIGLPVRTKTITGNNSDNRRHSSNSEGNRAKQNMPKKGQQSRMSVSQQKNYEEWKAERQQIDEERIARQKNSVGSFRREWDQDKVVAEPEKQSSGRQFYKIPEWANSNNEYQRKEYNHRGNNRSSDRGTQYRNKNQSFGPKYEGEGAYDHERKDRLDDKDSTYDRQSRFNRRGNTFRKDQSYNSENDNRKGSGNRGRSFRGARRDYNNSGLVHSDNNDYQRSSRESDSLNNKSTFTSKNETSSVGKKNSISSSGWSDNEGENVSGQKSKPQSSKKTFRASNSSGTWSDTEDNNFNDCSSPTSNEKQLRSVPQLSGNWSDTESVELHGQQHSKPKVKSVSGLVPRNSVSDMQFSNTSYSPAVDTGSVDHSNSGERNPKSDSYHGKEFDRKNRVFNRSFTETNNSNTEYDSTYSRGRITTHSYEGSDRSQESQFRGKRSYGPSSNFAANKNKPEYTHKDVDNDRYQYSGNWGGRGRGFRGNNRNSFQRPFQRESDDFEYPKNKDNFQSNYRGGRNNFQRRGRGNFVDGKKYNEKHNFRNPCSRADDSHASKTESSRKKDSNSKAVDDDGIWGGISASNARDDGIWGEVDNVEKCFIDIPIKAPEVSGVTEDTDCKWKSNECSNLQNVVQSEDDMQKDNKSTVWEASNDNVTTTESVQFPNAENSSACSSLVNIENELLADGSKLTEEHFLETDQACNESHDDGGSWTTISGGDSLTEQIEEEYIDIDEGREYQYSSYLGDATGDTFISTCEMQVGGEKISEIMAEKMLLKEQCVETTVNYPFSPVPENLDVSNDPSSLSCHAEEILDKEVDLTDNKTHLSPSCLLSLECGIDKGQTGDLNFEESSTDSSLLTSHNNNKSLTSADNVITCSQPNEMERCEKHNFPENEMEIPREILAESDPSMISSIVPESCSVEEDPSVNVNDNDLTHGDDLGLNSIMLESTANLCTQSIVTENELSCDLEKSAHFEEMSSLLISHNNNNNESLTSADNVITCSQPNEMEQCEKHNFPENEMEIQSEILTESDPSMISSIVPESCSVEEDRSVNVNDNDLGFNSVMLESTANLCTQSVVTEIELSCDLEKSAPFEDMLASNIAESIDCSSSLTTTEVAIIDEVKLECCIKPPVDANDSWKDPNYFDEKNELLDKKSNNFSEVSSPDTSVSIECPSQPSQSEIDMLHEIKELECTTVLSVCTDETANNGDCLNEEDIFLDCTNGEKIDSSCPIDKKNEASIDPDNNQNTNVTSALDKNSEISVVSAGDQNADFTGMIDCPPVLEESTGDLPVEAIALKHDDHLFDLDANSECIEASIPNAADNIECLSELSKKVISSMGDVGKLECEVNIAEEVIDNSISLDANKKYLSGDGDLATLDSAKEHESAQNVPPNETPLEKSHDDALCVSESS